MARPRILDHLQNFKFHMLDVSIARSGTILVPVFNPILGFSSITAPELSGEMNTINAGNNEFPYKTIQKANVGTITCQRGIQFYDTDFWNWVIACVKGGGTNSRRRNLLLTQFANLDISSTSGAIVSGGLTASLAAGLTGKFNIVESVAITGGLIGAGVALGLVPIRAWLLQQCIATRVKAGSDFEATSGEVSIQELDIEAHIYEEFALGL